MARVLNRTTLVLPAAIALAVALGSAGAAAQDSGWPREINSPEGKIVLYQLQPESLDKNVLKGRAAVSITPKGKNAPVFGALWFEAKVDIDRDARTVEVVDLTIPRVRMPESTDEESRRLGDVIEKEVPRWDLSFSLDRMVAALNAAKEEHETAEELNMTPPKILFEKEPAVLVVIDGEPKLVPMKGTHLERVVNTPFFMVRAQNSATWYLSGGEAWYRANDALGPWVSIRRPPEEVADAWAQQQREHPAGAEGSEGEAAAAGPSVRPGSGRTGTFGGVSAGGEAGGEPPKVIVSTEPAELVVTDGAPKFAPIGGDQLLYVTNTDSDLFMDTAGQQYYVLLSGRWFRSNSMSGPWEYVRPDHLPEAFARLPENSPKGEALASVSGTPQAEEAVMDSAVPQTAAVRRDQATLSVGYDGEPRFQRIPHTQVEYALNASTQVLRIHGRYYACDQGVWFVADDPGGPWAVADSVPDDVQQIPPDTPVYNTKYVYIYDSTPDVVYVGYLPGYVGCYPYYGTVVWGTGWYYRGWIGNVYYPWPWTWGFHAHFSPWAGWSFGFGFGYYGWGPFRVSFGWARPWWWGPVGFVPCNRPALVARSFPSFRGAVPVGSRPLRGTNLNLYRQPQSVARVMSTRDKVAMRPRATVAAARPNNVLVDREGNVYRRTQQGWQQRQSGAWKAAPGVASAPPPPRGAQARGVPRRPGQPGAIPPPPGARGPSARPAPMPAPNPSVDRDWRGRQRGDARVQAYRNSGGGRYAPPPQASHAPPPQGGGHASPPPPHGGGGGGGGGHPAPPRSGGHPRGGGRPR